MQELRRAASGGCPADTSEGAIVSRKRIVLDAMGGDHAPATAVAGAVVAADRFPDIVVVLTGPIERIQEELNRCGGQRPNIELVDAPEVIGMHESPASALREKKRSSIAVGVQLVGEGKAEAFLSAGNTGAVVVASTLGMRLIRGVQRPGIAVPLKVFNRLVVAIDMGANLQCKATHLLQYAIMANVFARDVLKIENPRIGLLNIGEEDQKGTDLLQRTFEMLSESDLNFVGNVEGHDLFSVRCDIMVCEGFVGNALLKFGESFVIEFMEWFSAGVKKKLRRKIGYLLVRDLFRELKDSSDYTQYGGAPLLGVNGVVIVTHGRSDAKAIENAIREARYFVENNINDRISHAIRHHALRAEDRNSQNATA